LELAQASQNSGWRPRVGGFSVGIAASCIACEFELLDGSICYPMCGEGCRVLLLTRERGPEALGMDEFAGRSKHGP
jgi:hypothetical protein